MDDRQAVITSLGLVLGAFLAYLQIQRNARAALELQERHSRNELKLKLYERISQVISEANDHLSKANTQYFPVLLNLDLRVRRNIPAQILDSAMALGGIVHEAQRRVSRVLTTLEEYEIVFLKFGEFRRQLFEEHQKLLETHRAFWTQLLPYAPFIHNVTKEQLQSPLLPTPDELTELERMHDAFKNVCNDIGGYLIDLQIEAQNELLGDLFKRSVPPRSPLDPTVKVIARDSADLQSRPPGRLV